MESRASGTAQVATHVDAENQVLSVSDGVEYVYRRSAGSVETRQLERRKVRTATTRRW